MIKFYVCNYVYVFTGKKQWIVNAIIGRRKCQFCETLMPWFPIKGRVIFAKLRTRMTSLVSGYTGGQNTVMYIFRM